MRIVQKQSTNALNQFQASALALNGLKWIGKLLAGAPVWSAVGVSISIDHLHRDETHTCDVPNTVAIQ